MKRPACALALTALLLTPCVMDAAADAGDALAGRWDLTIKTSSETYPSWVEVNAEGKGERVRVQGRESSVHPVENLKIDPASMSFDTTEWFGRQMKVRWTFEGRGGRLTGTQKREDGVEGAITGVRAPALKHEAPAAWSDPVPLFNGKDLAGWTPNNSIKKLPNHWKAIEGELVNESPGANIQTTRKFGDFKLHLEYNCPQDGNSGVYLRGRYELQVAYEPPGKNDRFHGMGAIYGFLAPEAELPDKPGQWESFDITLVGRWVTVVRDGVKTIDNREIPGITGGALDSNEAQPNSLYIQGDHTGGMKYRHITIAVPQSK